MTLVETRMRILFGNPDTAIPDLDLTCAILTGRYTALEPVEIEIIGTRAGSQGYRDVDQAKRDCSFPDNPTHVCPHSGKAKQKALRRRSCAKVLTPSRASGSVSGLHDDAGRMRISFLTSRTPAIWRAVLVARLAISADSAKPLNCTTPR